MLDAKVHLKLLGETSKGLALLQRVVEKTLPRVEKTRVRVKFTSYFTNFSYFLA